MTQVYGYTVTHPAWLVRFVEPEPLTRMQALREWVHCAWCEFWAIAVPSFWFALSITAFRWSIGAL